jgi:hypothetical protein
MAWTIEEARDRAGLAGGDTSQDAALTLAMALSVAQVENYCDRKILLMPAVEEIFYRTASRSVQLERYPLVFVSSVQVAGNDWSTYDVDLKLGRILFKSVPYDEVTVAVTYNGGYDPEALPPDLELVLWSVFDGLYNDGAGAGGDSGGIGGIGSIQVPDVGTIRFDNGSGTGLVGNAAVGDLLGPFAPLLQAYVRYSA